MPGRPDEAGTVPGRPGEAGTLPAGPAVVPLVPGIVRWQRRARRRPLPDAVAVAMAVKMLPIPESAPPYDDEADVSAPAAAAAAGEPGWPAGASGQSPPARLAIGPRPAGAAQRAPIPAASPGWPGKFAQVLAETLAGSRPPRQITPWTTDRARRHIQRLGPLLAAREQPRVRRIVTSRPAADVIEMTVIVGVGQRVRALAVRLERDGPRLAGPGRHAQAAGWICTAVEAA